MIEKNLWPDTTLLKQAAMIFSSAFDALWKGSYRGRPGTSGKR